MAGARLGKPPCGQTQALRGYGHSRRISGSALRRVVLLMPTLRGDMPTVALVLLALWVLGSVGSVTMGGGLHIFLLASAGIMLPRIIRGKAPE
jgi:hypothetical protein